ETEDLHYERHRKTRTWGAEVFPGASIPNAMVQLSPVTQYGSGAGYQYEDKTICGFAHTNKGHWNLLHVPFMPVAGRRINIDNFASHFSHDREEAHPGFYYVNLTDYDIDVELTSTLRCAYHRYTFNRRGEKRVIADLAHANNTPSEWKIEKTSDRSFTGFQRVGGEKMYFYAETNANIHDIAQMQGRKAIASVIDFEPTDGNVIEMKVGFSFVSIEGAKANFKAEIEGKDFTTVRQEADVKWEQMLSMIKVEGNTERMKGIFYSCLYRSLLWPVLRSDVNCDYTDVRGNVCNEGFHYYTDPSFWDDHRNKLVLLELLQPEVTVDIIKSCIDRGEKRGGYMPTFFHGDHASTFVSGSWLRGLQNFDLNRAYKLLLKNATVPGRGGRPYLDEYLKQGWISEKDTTNVPYYNEYKGAVTKTLEYSYDDYATALVARILGDKANEKMLLEHSKYYKNVFDEKTGFYRGKIASGEWIEDFDPYYPYFQYMYRESNAWNNLFYAPHDIKGMMGLYKNDKRKVEGMLDKMFAEPWRGYEVENLTGFIGNYCHGNQPGHSIPYVYYFCDKQEKSQAVLDSLMYNYYDMGRDHLALAGMDDAGEMSSWFVFNAIGMYTYSPADPEYLVTVPIFDKVTFNSPARKFTIEHHGKGRKITSITSGGKKLSGYFLNDKALREGRNLVITTK
ncbi:MAG: GH92 family glycosyl hydrolase, partial [Prevotellaceae bacterium]|nr:GH92 family glycosyl hydrolase [Prevotellaceae bacterium]